MSNLCLHPTVHLGSDIEEGLFTLLNLGPLDWKSQAGWPMIGLLLLFERLRQLVSRVASYNSEQFGKTQGEDTKRQRVTSQPLPLCGLGNGPAWGVPSQSTPPCLGSMGRAEVRVNDRRSGNKAEVQHHILQRRHHIWVETACGQQRLYIILCCSLQGQHSTPVLPFPSQSAVSPPQHCQMADD